MPGRLLLPAKGLYSRAPGSKQRDRSRPETRGVLCKSRRNSPGLRRYGPAMEDFSFAVRLEPRNAEHIGSVGWTQYLTGQTDTAIQTDRKALALGNVSWVHANLALCYATLGNWPLLAGVCAVPRQAGTEELAGITTDVRDALKKQPQSVALHNALSLLQGAASSRPGPRRSRVHL